MSLTENFLTRRAKQLGLTPRQLRQRIERTKEKLAYIVQNRDKLRQYFFGKLPLVTNRQRKVYRAWAMQYGVFAAILCALSWYWIKFSVTIALQVAGFIGLPVLIATIICARLAFAPVADEVDHD